MRKLGWSLVAVALSAAILALAGAGASSADVDLSGTWRGTNDASTYVITQRGDAVTWFAHSADNKQWAHDFKGRIRGDLVVGTWKDRLTHQIRSGGSVTFRIVDEDRLVYVESSASFGTQGMERAGWGPWPALPDALVDIRTVSNGCGPGEASTAPSPFDTNEYPRRPVTDPNGPARTVDFRPACNMHDAAYSGAKVRDELHGDQPVDTFDWTKAKADSRFKEDLLLLCKQKLGEAGWEIALRACEATAQKYYRIVQVGGTLAGAFKDRPRLTGAWTSSSMPGVEWSIHQTGRRVVAIWRSDTVRGEFRGTLVSHDRASTVDGTARITDGGKRRSGEMHFIWTPRGLTESLSARGPGVSTTLTRASA